MTHRVTVVSFRRPPRRTATAPGGTLGEVRLASSSWDEGLEAARAMAKRERWSEVYAQQGPSGFVLMLGKWHKVT